MKRGDFDDPSHFHMDFWLSGQMVVAAVQGVVVVVTVVAVAVVVAAAVAVAVAVVKASEGALAE